MIRLAVIGAGAVAEQGYLPAIEALPDATIGTVIDADDARARAMAAQFDADRHATTHIDHLDTIDGAIIATPPAFHAEIARACLDAGIHVLTEKPVATDVKTARSLVDRAAEAGLHYAISRQQREAPAVRAMRSVLETGGLGNIESFRARFGDQTNWAFASDYRMRSSLSWGGALTDKGPHILDVLMWLLSDLDLQVTRYQDDNLGGLEANLVLTLADDTRDVAGTVEITASRAVPNELTIVGSKGTITADPGAAAASISDYITGERTRITTDGDAHLTDYLARIAAQTNRFVEAIASDASAYVPARTDIQLIDLIETCYATRTVAVEPWEARHLDIATQERIDG